MARKPRIQDSGMIHHVIVRGNNSQDIFKDNNDRTRYLHLLHRYKKRFKFKILAYCFMDNHIHLLLKQSEIQLSKFMAGLQQSYTQYYNCKYSETGHVFEQRFKSFPCSDEAYYLSLIAYIHNNPKKAGIVDNIDSYEWSSHKEILNDSNNNLCDVEELFELIGRDRVSSISEYLWLLGKADDIERNNHYMDNEELELSDSSAWIDERKDLIDRKKISIEQIDNEIKLIENERLILFNKSDYRKIFTIIATKYSALENREIANYLNIKPSRVSRIKREYLEGSFSYYLVELINDINDRIN